MKVFVSGIAGFLGSTLARRLCQLGHVVSGADLLHRDEAGRLRGVPLDEYFWQDIQDVREVAPYVIHCAGPVDVGHTQRSPRLAAQQAAHATTAICEAALRSKEFRRLVLISSYSAYGRVEKQPIVEEEALRPATLYGAMKASQEAIALSYFRSHGLPVTVVRLSTLYGPASRATLPVRLFMSKILAGEPITLTGDGSQVRDQNFVDNAVEGIIAALATDGTPGEVFNLGSGLGVSMLELARACADALKIPADVKLVAARAGEEGKLVLDISKARRVLSYDPKVRLEEGLKRMATWMREAR